MTDCNFVTTIRNPIIIITGQLELHARVAHSIQFYYYYCVAVYAHSSHLTQPNDRVCLQKLIEFNTDFNVILWKILK